MKMKKMIVETKNAWEVIGKPKKLLVREKNIKKIQKVNLSSKK